MIEWIKWTCIWHLKIWRGKPSWLCWTALASVMSQIKAFQTKLVSVRVCGLKKRASGSGLCLFIYKHQYAWQWRKITYVSHYVHIQQSFARAQICACAWKNIGNSQYRILCYCTRTAHGYTKSHKRTSAVSFIHERWLKSLIIPTKVSQ